MLAILHKDSLLSKDYNYTKKTDKQIENLKKIFLINSQKAEIDENNLKLQKGKLSRYQVNFHKNSLIIGSVFVVLVSIMFLLSSIVSGFGIGDSPFFVYNQTQLIMALKTNKNYELKNDITITKPINSSNFSGTFNGNGHAIYMQNLLESCLIQTNSGTIKNLNLVYLSENSNDLNDEFTKQISATTSLFVKDNKGVIENLSIKTPKLNLTFDNSAGDIFFNGIAINNSGSIKNCSVSISANIVSNIAGEGYFSGFVGTNSGIVENCVYENGNEVTTYEVDASGLVNINNIDASIKNCKNYANISHESEKNRWSPNASGIVIINYGSIKNCLNYGDIKVISNNTLKGAEGLIYAGGICSLNHFEIDKCLNKGQINAFSKRIVVYAGGISAVSVGTITNNIILIPIIKNCGVEAKIDVRTEDENPSENKFTLAFAGGISGRVEGYVFSNTLYFGVVENCYSLATFENVDTENADKKYAFSSCIGLTTSNLTIETFKPINNHCLIQEGIQNKLGAVIYNGNPVSLNAIRDTFGIDIDERYQNEIIGYDSKEKIMKLEVYWNE